MSEKVFSDIDGLVLAMISCNPDNNIVTWISFIDAYYRIIISYDELKNSLYKLQKSGFVTFQNNRFFCTEQTEKVLCDRDKMGITTWIFKVQERLAKLSFSETFDIEYNLLKSEYEIALKHYRTLWRNRI